MLQETSVSTEWEKDHIKEYREHAACGTWVDTLDRYCQSHVFH